MWQSQNLFFLLHAVKCTGTEYFWIHRIVLGDQKFKVREIADIVKISQNGWNVVYLSILIWKRFVQNGLAFSDYRPKQQRVNNSEHASEILKCNPNKFFSRFVTMIKHISISIHLSQNDSLRILCNPRMQAPVKVAERDKIHNNWLESCSAR